MDHATANLPSRDFEETSRFYGALGFEERFRDDGWMILAKGGIILEFFPHPELDPLTSWFSACFRIDDVDAFHTLCRQAGIAEACMGYPRVHAPKAEDFGLIIGALIDCDGSLIRFIRNQ